MRKLCYILTLALCAVCLFSIPAFAGCRANYSKAAGYIKERQYDFALMEFRTITRDYPETKYARESLFAIGEYFYMEGAFQEANRYFSEFIKTYPDSKAAIFAKAYLLKIIRTMRENGGADKKIIEDIEMGFFSHPMFLLFSEYKEVRYKSAFRNKFKVRYYIDKIEVYRNETTFLEISR